MVKHTFSYQSGNSEVMWDIRDIWEAVEETPAVKVRVNTFKKIYNEAAVNYTEDDYERIEDANLKYPIIISQPIGSHKFLIVDGYHRIGKCLEENRSTIDVKYIRKMPRPLFCKGKPFTIEGLDFEWYDPRSKK